MGCANTKLDTPADPANPNAVTVEVPKVVYSREELSSKLQEQQKRIEELEALCKTLRAHI